MSTLAEKGESHISIDSSRHYEIFNNKDTLYIKNTLNILFFVFKINIVEHSLLSLISCGPLASSKMINFLREIILD